MSYRKRRRVEYVVLDMFRRRGWLVIRAAGSKTPVWRTLSHMTPPY